MGGVAPVDDGVVPAPVVLCLADIVGAGGRCVARYVVVFVIWLLAVVSASGETEEVDGIRAVVASPSQDVFYDLQGRRITHPAKGFQLMRPATGSHQGKTVKVFMK